MMASRIFAAGAPEAYQPYESLRAIVPRRADRSDASEPKAHPPLPKVTSVIKKILFLALVVFGSAALADDFDHQHNTYADVLGNHVEWNEAGTASTVDYKALTENPENLNQYLKQLSDVEKSSFDNWNKDQQLAFLINAYNAFTLKLIVDHYPVDSIKDIGAFWQNPWKKRFFTLLGEDMHLDQVEHDIIREPGVYNEPRIHFAVNCASIGCPALRTEPFTAERLEQQLENSTERFLRDETRNRYRDGQLEVSSVFKWYREDFERGWQGIDSLHDFFLGYTEELELDGDAEKALESGEMDYRFLDYDWSLNEH